VSELRFPYRVVATIQESIGPVDRGAKYEDPLHAALKTASAGEVQGAGSQLNPDYKIAFVDIDLALADLDRSLELTRETLKRLGAPTGSTLSFPSDGSVISLAIDNGAPLDHPAAGTTALDRRLIGTGTSDSAEPDYDMALVAKVARNMLASYRQLMVDAYRHATIDRAGYDAALFDWYDAIGRGLSGLGFDSLGDMAVVTDPSRSPAPGAPFARRFVSRDGLHRADIFQLRHPKTGAFTRAMNIVSEFSGGRFVWTTTSPKRWRTPDHTFTEYLSADTDVQSLYERHRERHATYARSHADEHSVALTSLESVIASEQRCQAATAAFRRRQAVPAVDELIALGTRPRLAALAHEEMRRLLETGESSSGDTRPESSAPVEPAAQPATQAPAGRAWHVTSVELPRNDAAPMALHELIQFSLDQGIKQVRKVGSPLNPFLVLDDGRAFFFVCESGDPDPLEIALKTLRADGGNVAACALVLDSKIISKEGTQVDAIVVMASTRGGGDGETWAQTYRPKFFLRAFKLFDFRERVAGCRNFFGSS